MSECGAPGEPTRRRQRVAAVFVAAATALSGLAVVAPASSAAESDGSDVIDVDYANDGTRAGLYLTHSDGRVEARAGLPHFGDRPMLAAAESVIGLSVRPAADGYWLFTDLGRAFAFGAATHHGDAGQLELAAPMISAIATPDGEGYYMVAQDGGIFSYGSAEFYGSIPQILPGVALDEPVIGIVPSSTGRGYLLVASDGGIFTFGDARFHGSVPGVLPPGATLDSPVVAVIAQPTGYLMVAGDGGIFTFGTAEFFGSLGGTGASGIIGVAVVPDNSGYVMANVGGDLYPFGSATGLGSTGFDSSPALEALQTMTVVPDLPGQPYDRDDYQPGGWPDTDADCQNDRHEVLARESEVEVTYDPTGCFVETGRWTDPYSREVFTAATDVQIDHVVPLSHAHRVGGWRWDAATKQAFASDLEFEGTLAVVGAATNGAKSDSGPDRWNPPSPSGSCPYALSWIYTKDRWGLPLESEAERTALTELLASCEIADPNQTSADGPLPAPTSTTTTTAPSVPPTGAIRIVSCDARAEIVRLANESSEAVSLAGHRLHDDGVKHHIDFEASDVIGPNETLDVRSGPSAKPGPGVYFWHNGHVWNNTGDTAHLIDPSGDVSTVRCST